MGKEHLEYVRDRLSRARRSLKEAEEGASQVGDKDGAGKISKAREEVEKVEADFGKKM